MPRKGYKSIRLCGLALIWAAVTGAVPAQGGPRPDPLAEWVDFLEAEVAKLQKTKTLSTEALRESLLRRFPLPLGDGKQARVSQALLLQAAIRVKNLDTRDYNEPRAGAGDYEPPEDVARETRKVYTIDLFNALLGYHDRMQPARDQEGKTALMYAAEAGRFDVLRTILLFPEKGRQFLFFPKDRFVCIYPQLDEKKRHYIDWCDKDGYTALMYASTTDNAEPVNYLLNAGAEIHTQCEVARFDALQLAQNYGHDHVIRALERKLNTEPWPLVVLKSPGFATALLWTFVLGGWTFSRIIGFAKDLWHNYIRERFRRGLEQMSK